jgi:hypothetical protein
MTMFGALDKEGDAFYFLGYGAGTVGDPFIASRYLEAAENHIGNLGGHSVRVEKEITRPANTTAYTILDCVADNSASNTTHKITDALRKVAGTGLIISAVLSTDNLSWTTPITAIIYDKAVPAAFIADNAAFDPMYADHANIACQIQFPSFQKVTGGAGAKAWAAVENLNRIIQSAAASKDIYFQLYLPSAAQTPASGQKFTLTLGIIQD